jgi:hypothetical protein
MSHQTITSGIRIVVLRDCSKMLVLFWSTNRGMTLLAEETIGKEVDCTLI